MIKETNLARRRFLEQIVSIPITCALPRFIFPRTSRIEYKFQKGDTIYSLKKFYGDSRSDKEIAGKFNPKDIPIGAEVGFIVNNEKFREFGLYPNNKNWHRISQMSGNEFSKFLDVFGYKEHTRLIQGLIPGDYEKNFTKQLDNIGNFRREINLASEEHSINPLYLTAIGITESGLRTKTISPKGPIGAWALSKYIFDKSRLGNRINPYNKESSTQRSAEYLAYLKEKYSKEDNCLNSKLWITAYNAGETAVNELLKKTEGIKNFDEMLKTRFKGFGDEQARYIKKVEANLNKISKYFTILNGKISRI